MEREDLYDILIIGLGLFEIVFDPIFSFKRINKKKRNYTALIFNFVCYNYYIL